MISFIDSTEQTVTWSEEMHTRFTEAKITEAWEARFGKTPTKEDILNHVVGLHKENGTITYIWLEEPDLDDWGYSIEDKILCIIAPFSTGGPMQ